MSIEYTERKAIITRIGNMRTEFKPGMPVTIKTKDKSFPGVSVGVQFDFEPDVWYQGILFEKQAASLKEGMPVEIKTWEKESNGTIYKNFGIMQKKTADASDLERKFAPLIPTVERQGKQIMSMYADLLKIKEHLGLDKAHAPSSDFDAEWSDHMPDSELDRMAQEDINPEDIPF